MRTRLSFLLTLLIVLGALSPLAAPPTHAQATQNPWVFAQAYTPDSNPPAPSSPWSYGWKASLTGTFSGFWHQGETGGIRYWDADNGATIWKNTSSQTINGVAPGEISLHPGSGGQYAVVRWIAPAQMKVMVSAEFGAGDSGEMTYYILLNNQVRCQVRSTATVHPTPLYLSVNVGDTIEFLVGDGYYSGNTPLKAAIILFHTPKQGNWDIVRDFDIVANPDGGLEYGWKATANGTFQRFTESGTQDGRPYWKASNTAIIWKNTSSEILYGVKTGEISLHPGQNNEYTTVRWTAPGKMKVFVNSLFGVGDSGVVMYVIVINGHVSYNGVVRSGSIAKSFDVYVNAGDTIDVEVGGTYSSANTPLQLQIAQEWCTADACTKLTSNPEGDWQYGWKDTYNAGFQPFTMLQTIGSSSPQWIASNGAYIWKNLSSETIEGVAPREISLHPGGNGEYATVRWTAPRAGIMAVTTTFKAGNTGAVREYIELNGQVLREYYGTDVQGYNYLVAVNPGDTLDFMVGQTYEHGNTPLLVGIYQMNTFKYGSPGDPLEPFASQGQWPTRGD